MAANTGLFFFGLIVFQGAYGHRFIRSPDKMEVEVPNRDRPEYQDNMDSEMEYWHGQGSNNGEAGHGDMDHEKEKNEETYDHEKEHHHNNEQTYQKEMNETYQSDKDKAQSHNEDNQEHYDGHHDDIDEDNAPTMDTDAGDRYGDKGNEHKEETGEKMENYEPGQNNPSFSYTRD